MKLIAIETQDFKALGGYREYQDIPDGIIGITGDNGRGKSTLMTAVAYAFYGPDVLDTGNSDVVTWGKTKARVAVWFALDGVPYMVWRGSDGKNSSATLARSGEPIAQSATEVTQEITRLLGVDRVGFLASVFSKQEDLLGIGSLQPAKRQSTVLRLLGIDQVDDAIKKINEETRSLNRDLNIMRLTVKPPEDGPTKAYMRKLDDELETVGANLHGVEELIDEATAELREIESTVEAYNTWASGVNGVKAQIKAHVEQLQDAQRRAEVKVPDLPDKPEPWIEPDVYIVKKADYERLRKASEATVCPTCGRPYDPTEAKKIYRQVEEAAEWVTDFTPVYNAVNAYLVNVESRKRMLETQKEDRQRVKLLQDRYEALAGTLDAMESKPVENPQTRYSAALATLSRLKDQRGLLAVKQAGLNMEFVNAKNRRAEREEAQRIYSEHADRINTLERQVLVNGYVSKHMAEYKSALIANVVPSITSKASSLITEMTEGRYTEVSLTPQYDIEYRNDQGDLKSFANLSGGEKDVFALALRLAIADIKAGSVGILVLDEVLESLDTGRQEATWDALERLSNRYNQIYMITHVDAFKDRAPHSLSV